MTDREQTRRDARKSPYGQVKQLVAVLEAELEQVKHDRDEWRASERRVLAELEQVEARLAKVPALVAVMRQFGHQCRVGELYGSPPGVCRLCEALTVWEQE